MIPKNPPATLALIAVSVIAYVLMTVGMRELILGPLMISKYLSPTLPEVFNGEVWRLVTPIFLHFSIYHIVFNMLLTWEFGRIIEWRQGVGLFLFVVLITALVSNLAQYFVSGPVFGGMSGVIYGLFGYLWIQSYTNPRFGVKLNPVVVKFLLGWFLICWSGILEKLFNLAVANTAHTAGLVSGMVMALLVSMSIRMFSK